MTNEPAIVEIVMHSALLGHCLHFTNEHVPYFLDTIHEPMVQPYLSPGTRPPRKRT